MLVVSKLEHWQNYSTGFYLLYITTRFIHLRTMDCSKIWNSIRTRDSKDNTFKEFYRLWNTPKSSWHKLCSIKFKDTNDFFNL